MYYKMRKNGSLWGRFLVGGGRGKAGVVWAADAVGGEKRAGARGIDLGGSGTLAWMGRNGGAPRQFVRKTDVFPTQCLLKSGVL